MCSYKDFTAVTRFWGRPVYLSAIVLVPEGFDVHPEARHPLIVFHDHFVSTLNAFREEPSDPNLKPDYSDRFHLPGYNRIMQQEAYKNYQAWIAPGTPRMLIIKLQHANPYYDDSYAVNSANVGPYGDAIETELIPAMEQQFDIWQAVFSPVGEDGYPQPIFDKRTGVIDHQTAAYWQGSPCRFRSISVRVADIRSEMERPAVRWPGRKRAP